MFGIILNKDFPYKKLRKLLAIATAVFLLQAVLFGVNLFYNEGFTFYICAIVYVFNCIFLFGTGVFKKPRNNYDEEFYGNLGELASVAFFSSTISSLLGLFGIFAECTLREAQSTFIFLIVFYLLNVVNLVLWLVIESCLSDVYESLYEINKYKKNTDVSFEVSELKPRFRERYVGLSSEEIDIIRPALSKIYKLWKSSYNDEKCLIRPGAFWETTEFLNNSIEVLDAYKKGKIDTDLNFLENFNKSAEDFYNTIYSKEQALRDEELKAAMEIFKIKSQKTLKEE